MSNWKNDVLRLPPKKWFLKLIITVTAIGAQETNTTVADAVGMLISKTLKNSNQIGLIVKSVYNEIIKNRWH